MFFKSEIWAIVNKKKVLVNGSISSKSFIELFSVKFENF